MRTSCLPKLNEGTLVGKMATVTGWGKPSDDSNSKSPVLRYYKGVPIIDNDTCQRYYGSAINAGSICIDTTGSHGVCNVSSKLPVSANIASTTISTPNFTSDINY